MNMKRINYIVLNLSIAMLFAAFTVQAQQNDGMEKIVIDGKVYYLYKVKKSEGFFRISANYGVSQKELMEANPEAVAGLKEGQLIKIPVISGRNSNKQEINSTSYIYHTVEPGQTAFFLSQKYHVPEQVIYDNNPGSEEKLLEGAIVKIPKSSIVHDDQEVLDSDNYIIYVVQPKDSLYAISKKYGVPMGAIIASNPALKSGVLEIGTSLRIPQKEEKKQVVKVEEEEKLEDDKYIYHSIEEDETIYSISQKYNAKQSEVEAANSSVDSNDLPLGYLVRIPKASIKTSRQDTKEDDNLFIYHKMKKRETASAISREYNVDINILRTVNSDKDLDHVKKGEIVKVPNRYWFKKIQDQEKALAEKEDEPKDDLVKLSDFDCGSYNYYDQKPALKVAVLLPFNVEATLKANIIKEEKDGEEIERERDEKVVSRYSKVFVEFYQGTLLALEKMKEQGVNVEMFVYDTAPDTNKVKTILASAEMPYMNLIIGPAYPQNLPFVSEFSKQHSIPVVYPFSTKNDELASNVHLFQATPIDTLLFDTMVDKVVETSIGKRIVVIRTEDTKSEFENKLSEKIRNKVYWDSFKDGSVPDFVEYKFKQDDLASLEKMFSKEKGNVVIVPSIEEAQVNRIVTTVKGAQSKTKAEVTLWGLPEWLKYQTLNPEDIHALNGHMFSYYSVDYEDNRSEELIEEYRKWFGTEPMSISPYFQNANVTSNMSRFSLWGFDVSYFFLSALKEYGNNFEYCIANHHPYAVQSHLHFTRTSNWGGYYNCGLYILNFAPDYKVTVEAIDN